MDDMRRRILAAPRQRTTERAIEKELDKALKSKGRQAHTPPERLVDALALDTADYQDRGWSRPPAAREVVYARAPEAAPSVVARAAGRRPARTERDLPTVARFLLAGGWIRPTSMSESPFLLQKRSFDAKCQQPPDDAIHEITTTLSKLVEVDPSLPFVQKLDSGPVPALACPDEAHSFAGRPQLEIRERVSLGS